MIAQISIVGQDLVAVRQFGVCGRAFAKCSLKINPITKAAYVGSSVLSGVAAVLITGSIATSFLIPNVTVALVVAGEGLSLFARGLETGGDTMSF